jgi:nitric oxide dioxygenase
MNTSPQLTLSAKQKRLVRESFESIMQYDNSVVVLFYGRLFELAPEVRAFFKIDIREQSRKLLETLNALVDALDRFEELRGHLAELGRRHVNYGVEESHYVNLRSAMLWAMGQALGLEFDRETRAAWETLLREVSAVMLEAAATVQPCSSK